MANKTDEMETRSRRVNKSSGTNVQVAIAMTPKCQSPIGYNSSTTQQQTFRQCAASMHARNLIICYINLDLDLGLLELLAKLRQLGFDGFRLQSLGCSVALGLAETDGLDELILGFELVLKFKLFW